MLSALSSLAFALASVVLYGSDADAQSSTSVCFSNYSWAENGLGQDPCLMAAYSLFPCVGALNVPPLQDGYHWSGPNAGGTAQQCICSELAYTLFAACGACQGQIWITWSEWHTNCTQTYTSFGAIPPGTEFPHWAYSDVTATDDWNPAAAQALATPGAPESTPIATTTAPPPISTATGGGGGGGFSSTPTGFSSTAVGPGPTGNGGNGGSSGKSKSIAGPVAGGVVGGLVVLGALIGLIIFFARRSDRQPMAAGTTAPQMGQMGQPGYGPGAGAMGAGAAGGMAMGMNGQPMNQPTPRYAPVPSTGYAPTGYAQTEYDPQDPRTFPAASSAGGDANYGHDYDAYGGMGGPPHSPGQQNPFQTPMPTPGGPGGRPGSYQFSPNRAPGSYNPGVPEV